MPTEMSSPSPTHLIICLSHCLSVSHCHVIFMSSPHKMQCHHYCPSIKSPGLGRGQLSGWGGPEYVNCLQKEGGGVGILSWVNRWWQVIGEFFFMFGVCLGVAGVVGGRQHATSYHALPSPSLQKATHCQHCPSHTSLRKLNTWGGKYKEKKGNA